MAVAAVSKVPQERADFSSDDDARFALEIILNLGNLHASLFPGGVGVFFPSFDPTFLKIEEESKEYRARQIQALVPALLHYDPVDGAPFLLQGALAIAALGVLIGYVVQGKKLALAGGILGFSGGLIFYRKGVRFGPSAEILSRAWEGRLDWLRGWITGVGRAISEKGAKVEQASCFESLSLTGELERLKSIQDRLTQILRRGEAYSPDFLKLAKRISESGVLLAGPAR